MLKEKFENINVVFSMNLIQKDIDWNQITSILNINVKLFDKLLTILAKTKPQINWNYLLISLADINQQIYARVINNT